MTTAATVWGPLYGNKNALCLHGLASGLPTWYRVASRLVDAGYTVVAPDTLGHGLSKHAVGNDYTMQALAAALKLYLTPPPDLILAHSLGGALAVHLLPFLPEGHKVRVVLVDPALEVDEARLAAAEEKSVADTSHPPTVEQLMKADSRWTKQDAIIKEYASYMCDTSACIEIMKQNAPPWSFSSLLPVASKKDLSVVIIAADPHLGAVFNADHVSAIASTHPHVRVVTAKGAGHSVQRENPDLVVEVALGMRD